MCPYPAQRLPSRTAARICEQGPARSRAPFGSWLPLCGWYESSVSVPAQMPGPQHAALHRAHAQPSMAFAPVVRELQSCALPEHPLHLQAHKSDHHSLSNPPPPPPPQKKEKINIGHSMGAHPVSIVLRYGLFGLVAQVAALSARLRPHELRCADGPAVGTHYSENLLSGKSSCRPAGSARC